MSLFRIWTASNYSEFAAKNDFCILPKVFITWVFHIWHFCMDILFGIFNTLGQNCTRMCIFPGFVSFPSKDRFQLSLPIYSQLQVRRISPQRYVHRGYERRIENVSYGRYRNQFGKTQRTYRILLLTKTAITIIRYLLDLK